MLESCEAVVPRIIVKEHVHCVGRVAVGPISGAMEPGRALHRAATEISVLRAQLTSPIVDAAFEVGVRDDVDAHQTCNCEKEELHADEVSKISVTPQSKFAQ